MLYPAELWALASIASECTDFAALVLPRYGLLLIKTLVAARGLMRSRVRGLCSSLVSFRKPPMSALTGMIYRY
jgi:hypothetical protein